MGEKRMRSKWIIRIWLGRLTRYLVVPLVFCVILFPLYGLMHQQTEKRSSPTPPNSSPLP